ncbi:YraN family protein [Aquirhabdus sp.]|uniref:YraN family protein n=1 Tax=Aquirhabdus sp. TaxID=2824160 RepID=UPI00396CE5F6
MTVGRSTSPTHTAGQYAEERALAFLKTQGFTLVVQNFHGKVGEIDLVMTKDKLLIFVEVRLRRPSRFGSAAESVTFAKQRKISKTAALFLQRFSQYESYDCRFDVVTIEGNPALQDSAMPELKIDWLEGAFYAV